MIEVALSWTGSGPGPLWDRSLQGQQAMGGPE